MGRKPLFDHPMTTAEHRVAIARIMQLVRKRRGEQTHSGYRQDKDGYYAEPPEAVHALLDHETFVGEVLDPCCGSGTIPRVCIERGLSARGYDLIDRGRGYPLRDFFQQTELVDNIVCNPPYNPHMHNAQWVEHALNLARWKVVVLARNNWLESRRRHAFFERNPPARVLMFTSRVSIPPADRGIKRQGGSTTYAWFVFEVGYRGPTTIIRLPPKGA